MMITRRQLNKLIRESQKGSTKKYDDDSALTGDQDELPDGLQKGIIDKEVEIIKAELLNSGKPPEMIEKISKGKINKFIAENTLINQVWIMDPKKKVSDILKDKDIKILDFIRYKVGEGI